jgi:hypothetical protein
MDVAAFNTEPPILDWEPTDFWRDALLIATACLLQAVRPPMSALSPLNWRLSQANGRPSDNGPLYAELSPAVSLRFGLPFAK